MTGRNVALYYAWSHPAEAGANLSTIENRFPALFESRRLFYPQFQDLSDPDRFDQGIGGFLDHIMKSNFAAFIEQTHAQTGRPVIEIERVDHNGVTTPLDDALLGSIDSLIIISFDSLRTDQAPMAAEVAAITSFLNHPDHVVFVCPHHDIGSPDGLSEAALRRSEEADFRHHGDRSIPPQQRFGGFARALLAALGLPVRNRFGLRPARMPNGSPAPVAVEKACDRLGLLNGVATFNAHPHLPHLERTGEATDKMDVLARQAIDLTAPPHPFVQNGRTDFDALLQSAEGLFAGTLLVSDATLWSGTAGGLDSLRRLWTNFVQRPVMDSTPN